MKPVDRQAVVEAFLEDAALKTEVRIARVRLAVGILVMIREFILDDTLLQQGILKELVAAVSCALAIGFSLWVLFAARHIRWLSQLSVATDALFVFGLLLGMAGWPNPDYRGLLRQFDASAVVLVLGAVAYRFSQSAVVLGTVLNLLSVVTLLGVDAVINGKRETTKQYTLAFIVFGASAFFAIALARRTQRMVHDAAQAVLDAARSQQRLGAYVSDEVAAHAMALDALGPGGVTRQVAVLFSDLRSFTSFSESRAAENVIIELNAYFDAMVPVIRAEGGLIDKFIGDAIMVTFGVIQEQSDAAARAIRTAKAMDDALERHNADRANAGKGPLKHGIGVHFGPAVAGHVGTADRLQFTVIGDAVNVASRLESMTKQEGRSVLISEDAVRASEGHAPLPVMHRHGVIQVKGREQPITVFGLA